MTRGDLPLIYSLSNGPLVRLDWKHLEEESRVNMARDAGLAAGGWCRAREGLTQKSNFVFIHI